VKPVQCVLASSNHGKLFELANALSEYHIELVPQTEFDLTDAIEDASTFVENALIKARHACSNTGLCALADDSGLVVPALNGQPGIYSARYASTKDDDKPTDQDNIDKLLASLSTLNENPADRSAYFVCILVMLRNTDDPEPIIATGIWPGEILHKSEGDGGFGYDPIFFCPQEGKTAAAMGKEIKSRVSHRARALIELKNKLENPIISRALGLTNGPP